MKSSLVEINQIYIETASPASKHKELKSLYSKLPKDKVLLVDQVGFAKKIDTNRAQGILINAQVSVSQTLPLPKWVTSSKNHLTSTLFTSSKS